MRFLTWTILSILALAGCDDARSDFPVRAPAVQAEVSELATNVTIVKLTSENIALFSTPRNLAGAQTTMASGGDWDYRVGVGDILTIVVWDHPELSLPVPTTAGADQAGLRVQADGTFFYPYVGQVKASSRTPEQIRSDLTQKLSTFIPEPQVEVRVTKYNSQAVSVTGEVKTPNRQFLNDIPMTLLDAIDAAGGLTEFADPRSVIIRRGGRSFTVDLQAFLKNGVSANNPSLKSGDVVSVQKIEVQEAYLLGQIVQPSPIDLTYENVSLTQAVTRVGGLIEDQADARGIFVFRNNKAGVTVFQLDASNPVAFLLGTKFVLMPQDVIYVTSSPVHRWNRLISSLLPTLTTVRAANQLSGAE